MFEYADSNYGDAEPDRLHQCLDISPTPAWLVLFELTLITAALRGGRHADAVEMLAKRTAAKPFSAHAWTWYTEALDASGDARGAQQARDRITEVAMK